MQISRASRFVPVAVAGAAAFAAALLGAPPIARAQQQSNQHSVFSLVDNRPLAHLQRRGGLYIEAGAPGMARYVHFGRPLPVWRLRAVEDGRKVAVPNAAVYLVAPLNTEQAKSNTIWVGLKSPAKSSLKITGAGKASVPVPLNPGWQIIKVPMPDGAMAPGEARLLFNFAQSGNIAGGKGAAAVEFIQIGGGQPAQADAPMKGNTLSIPSGSGLTYYAWIPPGGALTAQGDGGGCKVTAAVNGGAPVELRLDGSALDLSANKQRFVRLDLAATGSCSAATLRAADLVTAGASPSLPAKAPPKNVILWLSDSTRADKFRIYNPKTRVESPFMTELARRATVFESAYVQGNESRVSHASLYTSLYPSVHNMISDKAKLSEAFTIIPEAVRPSKRFTIGVMGNGYIDKFWGFGDGWDFLVNHIHTGGGLKGEELLAVAKKQMAARGSNPFFLYVGSIDAHVSWRAHEPWLSKYDPTPYSGPFVKACLDPQLDQIIGGTLKINERDKVRVQALYDSDISYTDEVLKHLFDDLKAKGHDNDTMVIFTADHGEEMWDHGKVGHGQSLHEELVHVPLVIYYPPYFPGGKVVPEGVDVLDILPTITDALDAPTPPAVQGESLIPLAAGIGAGYPRPSIASQYELAHTLRLGGYKLWVGGSGDAHLHDVISDPHEDRDLWQSNSVERRALTDALGIWMANRNQWKKRRWGVSSNLKPAFAADMGQ